MAVREAILSHMFSVEDPLLGAHIRHGSVQEYIRVTRMNENSSWGTDVEIITFAHLVNTNVYTFYNNSWWLYGPHIINIVMQLDVATRSVYILHTAEPDHFQVVSSVV